MIEIWHHRYCFIPPLLTSTFWINTSMFTLFIPFPSFIYPPSYFRASAKTFGSLFGFGFIFFHYSIYHPYWSTFSNKGVVKWANTCDGGMNLFRADFFWESLPFCGKQWGVIGTDTGDWLFMRLHAGTLKVDGMSGIATTQLQVSERTNWTELLLTSWALFYPWPVGWAKVKIGWPNFSEIFVSKSTNILSRNCKSLLRIRILRPSVVQTLYSLIKLIVLQMRSME